MNSFVGQIFKTCTPKSFYIKDHVARFMEGFMSYNYTCIPNYFYTYHIIIVRIPVAHIDEKSTQHSCV